MFVSGSLLDPTAVRLHFLSESSIGALTFFFGLFYRPCGRYLQHDLQGVYITRPSAASIARPCLTFMSLHVWISTIALASPGRAWNPVFFLNDETRRGRLLMKLNRDWHAIRPKMEGDPKWKG